MTAAPSAPAPGRDPQLALLRIVCAVGWADGDLAEQERQLLEQLVARYFPEQDSSDQGRTALRQLTTWAVDPAALESAARELASPEDRLLALKLAYLMANVHQAPQDAGPINSAEKVAYRHLVECLGLSDQQVQDTEWAASQELATERGAAGIWRRILASLGTWPSQELLESPGMTWL